MRRHLDGANVLQDMPRPPPRLVEVEGLRAGQGQEQVKVEVKVKVKLARLLLFYRAGLDNSCKSYILFI